MSPHHLQQQDLYHERLVFAKLEALSPYSWGVVSMELDAGALGRAEISLSAFTGVLSDGVPVGFEIGDSERPPLRPVGEHYPAGQAQPLEVFLAVPREREGAPSFSDAASGGRSAQSRFSPVNRKVPDLVDVINQAEVTFGRKNLAFLFGDEPREDFATVKIAEIIRDANGSLITNPNYVPPCLRISASSYIMDGLRRLLGLILGKQKDLADRRRQRDAATLEFDAQDVTLFLQLNALNGLIPVIKHVSAAGDIAPYDLYMLLSQAAGNLATFSTEVKPVDLPSFVFTDLRSTFEPLFAFLIILVKQTVKETHIKVPLQIKNGIHFGSLEGEEYSRCRQFVLSVQADALSEEDVVERVPSRSKIASWNELQTVIRAAKPGVPIRVTHRPPAQIPVKAGVVYFMLDTSNPYWQTIARERRVGIYLPPPLDPTQANIELLAIPET